MKYSTKADNGKDELPDNENDGSAYDYRVTVNGSDPTETKTQRKSFKKHLEQQWRRVCTKNRDRLRSEQFVNRPGVQLDHHSWFRNLVKTEVLERSAPNDVLGGDHWTAPRIRTAYDKGLTLARRDLDFFDIPEQLVNEATRRNNPVHQRALKVEYEKVYGTIERQTDVATTLVDEQLREASENGMSIEWTVEATNKALKTKLAHRYTALANTSLVRATNTALLNSFAELDIDLVAIAIEGDGDTGNYAFNVSSDGDVFTTAMEENTVCQRCLSSAETVHKRVDVESDVELRPPLHPNCKCRVIPLPPTVTEGTQIENRVVAEPDSRDDANS